MIKLHISNLDSFFEVVNECEGRVNVIDENGQSTNIAHQIFAQKNYTNNILKIKNIWIFVSAFLILGIILKLFLTTPGIVRNSFFNLCSEH